MVGHEPSAQRLFDGLKRLEYRGYDSAGICTVPALLAYHVAVAKGTDVDQPRNLAKSVTVE